jgi:hypothetical protein
MTDRELAQGMYDAYGKSTKYKNFQGNPMPFWIDLPEAIQNAWIAAALYAKETVTTNQK